MKTDTKRMIIGFSVLILGVVMLFFEQSRGIAPFLIGGGLGWLFTTGVKRK